MRTFSVPDRVAFVVGEDDGPEVFLMPLPDGPPFVLQGTAAVIWVLAADGERDVAGAVGAVVGRQRAEVLVDVEDYLSDLVGKRLLCISE